VLKHLVLTLCLLGQPVLAAGWQFHTESSKLTYAVDFEQLPIDGRFEQFRVVFETAADKSPRQLTVTIDIASADMGNSDVNEAILDHDWFDVSRHAQASFTSSLFEKSQEGNYVAVGTLQLKGVTQSVRVPFSWQPSTEGPGAMLMTGQVNLNRLDFLIGTGDWASGDEIGLVVTVDFSVVFTSDNIGNGAKNNTQE